MTGTLSFPAEWKTIDGTAGELTGYASVFNVVDAGSDVVRAGAFKKTLSDWARARSRIPLLADHQLSTAGVIGSVPDAQEDGVGLRIRARFSSTRKAQDVRTNMVEGHLNGLSFTYEPVRSTRGVFEGQSVRFLDEVKVFEFTVTPWPMNALAVASAKGAYVEDQAGDLAELERLEQWAAGASATHALHHLAAHPDATAHALGVLSQAKDVAELARLTQWAATLPPRGPDDGPAERRRAQWARDNDYSNGLARTLANAVRCEHRSCMPGRCVYR